MPSHYLIAAIVTPILASFCVWTIATLHQHTIDHQAEQLLNPPMCVSTTGHKRVPCSKELTP